MLEIIVIKAPSFQGAEGFQWNSQGMKIPKITTGKNRMLSSGDDPKNIPNQKLSHETSKNKSNHIRVE